MVDLAQRTKADIPDRAARKSRTRSTEDLAPRSPDPHPEDTELPGRQELDSGHLSTGDVLALQHAVGNRAVHRLLQPTPAPSHQRSADLAGATAGTPAPPMDKPAGTLWAHDSSGKPLPPSLEDISQGTLNDCFLMAALAAVVNTDPQQITQMIQDNGNGTYTVTFKGIGIFSSATQTVSAEFVKDKHANVAGRSALWPLIVEKAYAQQKGGDGPFEKGGNPGDAVDDIINDSASRFDPREESVDYIIGKVAAGKHKKWPMTALAPKKDDASAEKKEMATTIPGLYFWHSYAIVDVDAAKNRIKLFNPWGHDHPNGDGWIDVEQVRKFFIEIGIND